MRAPHSVLLLGDQGVDEILECEMVYDGLPGSWCEFAFIFSGMTL
jgi:hypothetical protein